MKLFQPDKIILDRYADVLVNFALNSGKGVRKGEVVQCVVPDVAKPIYGPLQQALLRAGANPLMRFIATGFDKDYYEVATDAQLSFFPEKYLKARTELIDHTIAIFAEHDLHELQGVNPQKILLAAESKTKIRQWLSDKEYAGKFTWTLALYGTLAMAKEAGISLDNYWKQIIEACYLDRQNPIAAWKKTAVEIERVRKRLSDLKIERVHIEADDVDLWLTIGKRRRWMGGSGRNIPSFEVFVSPDWRGTQGSIAFNQPLYRYGNLIEGIKLTFENGVIVKATATKNQKLLKQIIERKDANKVGEFSLTDSRMSRITRFMANTLYDENVGGKNGNTHIAIGMSYKDAYDGDVGKVKKSTLDRLGFNNIYASEHCDMMSTSDRRVTALLPSGKEKVIYQEGRFTV